MDLDTTRTKTGYETILGDFEKGNTDILVGTQMVTKGLDFDRVNLVGIFDADRMMHFPDFRSYERAFQLILQVSGRAGRRDKQGVVVIQTSDPANALFNFVIQHDVTGFLEKELADRELHSFPPFSRLIEITLKHTDAGTGRRAADQFGNDMRTSFRGIQILGPEAPVISKIRNEFLFSILLKIPRNQGRLSEIKSRLLDIGGALQDIKEYRNCKIVFDVDPV